MDFGLSKTTKRKLLAVLIGTLSFVVVGCVAGEQDGGVGPFGRQIEIAGRRARVRAESFVGDAALRGALHGLDVFEQCALGGLVGRHLPRGPASRR